MSLKIPEILAPAGSFASLRAAIKAGCDSVFFGISDFNMRATASNNFTEEDLPKLTALCKQHNVKTYMTLNTVMYDSDLERMRRTIDLVKKHHVTAIIAADMATIAYAREKGVEVHISTQISISNIEGVKFYSQFSDRLVLARELRLEQVASIIDQIRERKIKGPSKRLVEIEVFAHGALCVSVSGRCGMSLYAYDRSANRGQCTQVCRKKYKVTDVANGKELIVDNNFIMSSADLCTIGMLPQLVKAGVDVLKFEGRGRPPEYVFTVIKTYKEALDSIKDGSYSKELVEKWNKRLKTVFNRGLSEGFYMGRKMSEWAKGDGSQATHTKIQLGIVERYYPKLKVAQIKIQANQSIDLGEEFLITSDKTGLVKITPQELRIDEKNVKKAHQGDEITFKIDEKVRKGDGVYVMRKK
jgi:U32 family peptidase